MSQNFKISSIHAKDCRLCTSLFKKITTFSFLLLETGCHSSKGWEVKDSHIASGMSHSDDAELVMYIKVDRFTQKKSQFSMDFEIEFCSGMNCRLKIQSVSIFIVCNDLFKNDLLSSFYCVY